MFGKRLNLIVVSLILLIFVMPHSFASTPAISVTTMEYISQVLSYDQTIEIDGEIIEAKGFLGENRTGVSRTGVELYDTTIIGVLNISNVETLGNTTLSSVNVTVGQTQNIESWYIISSPSYLIFDSSVDMDNPGGASETNFFIPELRGNDSLILGFNTTEGSYTEPVNFTEAYSDWRVMTGRSVEVFINVTNQFSGNVDIYDFQIFKTPHLYDSTNPSVDNAFFMYSDLRGADASNSQIFFDSYGRSVINWTPMGGVLPSGSTAEIIFNSTAPVNLSLNWSESSQWASWMNMGNLSASFIANGSLTGLNIRNVTAQPTDFKISASKERVNVDGFWNATANISNIASVPLDYKLQQITLWATKQGEFSDPGDQSSWIDGTILLASAYGPETDTTANVTWNTRLNLSAGTSFGNFSMLFNYSYIPIVWVTADFTLFDDGTQIYYLNQTASRPQDKYLYIEEIYVLLGGYLVKATKSLIPIESPTTAHKYLVNITIENIGDERTPELVTMFDLIPEGFNPLHFVLEEEGPTRELTADNNVLRVSDSSGDINTRIGGSSGSDLVLGAADSGTINSGPFEGYWGYHIDFTALEPNSNGNGLYNPSLAESEILVRYKIRGNHSLARIENAHIIGIDPIRLEGASPSQSVASRLSMTSSSSEKIILLSSITLSLSLLLLTLIIVKRFPEVAK